MSDTPTAQWVDELLVPFPRRSARSRGAAAPAGNEHELDLDELTLARAKAGDQSAQTALITRYRRAVCAHLRQMLGPDWALVEDITQETFLRVLRALPGFSRAGRARLITWIVTIATRQAIDHLRARRTRVTSISALGSIHVRLTRPDQDADRRELADALARAVGALGPPFRATFLLREVHGLSYEEIADTLDVDVGTVKSRLSRARGMLQVALIGVRDR